MQQKIAYIGHMCARKSTHGSHVCHKVHILVPKYTKVPILAHTSQKVPTLAQMMSESLLYWPYLCQKSSNNCLSYVIESLILATYVSERPHISPNYVIESRILATYVSESTHIG